MQLLTPTDPTEPYQRTTTVYVSIGNSDDKLSQPGWSGLAGDVGRAIDTAARYEGTTVHGRWYSLPAEPWQNACWCLEFAPGMSEIIAALRTALRQAARYWQQDSIAWAEATTEFLAP